MTAIVVLTLVGLVLGGFVAEAAGFFLGGLFGLFLGLGISLRRQIANVETELETIQRRLDGIAKAVKSWPQTASSKIDAPHRESPARPSEFTPVQYPVPEPPAVPETEETPPPTQTSPPQPLEPEPPAVVAAEAPPPLRPTPSPRPPEPEPPRAAATETPAFAFESHRESKPTPSEIPAKAPDFFERYREYLTTTHVVVGVGLIILFFGVAFLLKLAIDQGYLPLEVRYVAVALFGLALLAVGWKLRIRRPAYALLVQGGAVGILYITVFSAARWHGIVPLPLSFLFMVALVATAGALAVLQDSRSMAVYGAVGGFLAPILTSTGGGEHVILFSYYLLLNAGILGIAFYKTWRELNLIGFWFTLAIDGIWGLKFYRPEFFPTTEPFLIGFFLMYLTVSVLYALRQPPRLKGLVDGTLVFGLPLVAFGLQAGLVRNMEYGLAWSALALSAMYVGLAAALWRYRPQFLRMLAESFLALGVAFGSLAIPLALDARWTSAAWALEGAALVWIGVRQRRLLARGFGLVLELIAGAAFLVGLDIPVGNRPVLNGVGLGFLLLFLSGFITSYTLRRFSDRLQEWEDTFHVVFLVWGLLWWYAGGLHQIDKFVPTGYMSNAFLGFMTFSSLLWGFLYRRLAWKTLFGPTFALLPVLVVTCLIQATDFFPDHPFRRLGYIFWPFGLAAHLFLLKRHEDDLHEAIRPLLHFSGLMLMVFLAAWETSWDLDKLVEGGGAWYFITWGVVPALVAQAILKWSPRQAWPIAAHKEVYQDWGVPVLIGWAWIWLIGGSIVHAGDPWPLPYITIINPLEISQLFVLEVMTVWRLMLMKGQASLRFDVPSHQATYVLAGSMFVTANSIWARTVHYWGGVPFRLPDLWRSMVFQAGISIFWTLLALGIMAYATRKGWRSAWFVGAALLGVVVFKLFLVDLAHTGAVARIISFIVVGLLTLLIGYLSPVPPKGKSEAGA